MRGSHTHTHTHTLHDPKFGASLSSYAGIQANGIHTVACVLSLLPLPSSCPFSLSLLHFLSSCPFFLCLLPLSLPFSSLSVLSQLFLRAALPFPTVPRGEVDQGDGGRRRPLPPHRRPPRRPHTGSIRVLSESVFEYPNPSLSSAPSMPSSMPLSEAYPSLFTRFSLPESLSESSHPSPCSTTSTLSSMPSLRSYPCLIRVPYPSHLIRVSVPPLRRPPRCPHPFRAFTCLYLFVRVALSEPLSRVSLSELCVARAPLQPARRLRRRTHRGAAACARTTLKMRLGLCPCLSVSVCVCAAVLACVQTWVCGAVWVFNPGRCRVKSPLIRVAAGINRLSSESLPNTGAGQAR